MKSDEVLRKKCPTCGRTILQKKPKRVCFKCKQPIVKNHKYTLESAGEDGVFKMQHWNCDDPESYYDK